MAKRKRIKRRKSRRLGSTIRVRKLNGLGSLSKPASTMGAMGPPLIGIGSAALVTAGIRQFKDAPATLVQYSSWAGLAASSLIAAIMYNTVSKSAGMGTFAGGLGISASMIAMEYLAKMQLASAGQNGLAAIVPSYSNQNGVSGATIMEPLSARNQGYGPLGSYGETVNLGSIDTNVFGSRYSV